MKKRIKGNTMSAAGNRPDIRQEINELSLLFEIRQEAQEERKKLLEENIRLQEELKHRYHPTNIIGNSNEMQEVYDLIGKVADSDATVLLRGESGTGKELVAHAIHYASSRSHKPFIKVNCAALPETIIESELFGHEKGAFTGITFRLVCKLRSRAIRPLREHSTRRSRVSNGNCSSRH